MEQIRTIELPENVKKIIEELENHGYEAYAVGGCVRDSLLGKEPQDWDITTSALPEQVKELFPKTIDTGIQHGTVTVMMDHVGYEVTTYRIDGEYEDGRHPKQVLFTGNLVEDLKRRDFTINAMAYSDRTGIVDEFHGMGDLERGVIGCVGVAKDRFSEDALRILRAVRFSAQLGFQIEKETMQAACNMADTLKLISRERIQAELRKLLLSGHPERVEVLHEAGLLDVIFADCRKDEAQVPDIQRLSQILCRSVQDHFVRWGIFITCLPWQDMLFSLKFDNQTIKICEQLKRYQGAPLVLDDASVRCLAVAVGTDIFDKYYLPYRHALENASEEILEAVEKTYHKICERGDCLSLKTLKINGRDLVEKGIGQGTIIGDILEMLLQKVLEDETKNQEEVLWQLVEQYMAAKSSET